MEQLFLTGDVAKALSVQPYRIAYLFTSSKLEEPRLRLGNRRVFYPSDVRAVAKALGVQWSENEES